MPVDGQTSDRQPLETSVTMEITLFKEPPVDTVNWNPTAQTPVSQHSLNRGLQGLSTDTLGRLAQEAQAKFERLNEFNGRSSYFHITSSIWTHYKGQSITCYASISLEQGEGDVFC